jgi:hypothetical protein
VIGEVTFLDERVRPDFLEELVLRHEAAGPGGERSQHVERLGRQRNRTAIPQQETFGDVEGEVAELETGTISHVAEWFLAGIVAFRLCGHGEPISTKAVTNRFQIRNQAVFKPVLKTWTHT